MLEFKEQKDSLWHQVYYSNSFVSLNPFTNVKNISSKKWQKALSCSLKCMMYVFSCFLFQMAASSSSFLNRIMIKNCERKSRNFRIKKTKKVDMETVCNKFKSQIRWRAWSVCVQVNLIYLCWLFHNLQLSNSKIIIFISYHVPQSFNE